MKGLKALLTIIFSFYYTNCIVAQENQDSELKQWIDEQFIEGIEKAGIPGGTFVLVKNDSIIHIGGYGIGNIERNISVNPEHSIFQIASVTKTFVGVAIMQLYEKGKLEFDKDVNSYLKSFQLEYKFNKPITIRELLTHTSGLDQRYLYTVVKEEKGIVSLSEHLKKRLPPQVRPSGKVHTYSNYGYSLLGLIVEDLTEMTFKDYMEKHILQPLEMNTTSFIRENVLDENYVLNYARKNEELVPYELSNLLVYPAGGLNSTALDMSKYIRLFLNKGAYKGKKILDSTSIDLQLNPVFKHYKETTEGWSFGFTTYKLGDINIAGHGGDINEAHSQFMLFPEDDIGLFISINAENNGFRNTFLSNLLKKIIPEERYKSNSEAFLTPSKYSNIQDLERFEGVYRHTNYSFKTFDKLGVLLGLAPEITIKASDSVLRVLEWDEDLKPISNKTFYSNDEMYRSFGFNNNDEVEYFFSDGTSAYHKLEWYESIKFQVPWILIIVVMLLTALIVSIVRKFKKKEPFSIVKANNSISLLIIAFLLFFSLTLLSADPNDFLYGVPIYLKLILIIPFLIISLIIYSIWVFIKNYNTIRLNNYIFYSQSTMIIVFISFVWWMYYWNLIGFNF